MFYQCFGVECSQLAASNLCCGNALNYVQVLLLHLDTKAGTSCDSNWIIEILEY